VILGAYKFRYLSRYTTEYAIAANTVIRTTSCLSCVVETAVPKGILQLRWGYFHILSTKFDAEIILPRA
jgi:hypothetical protein